MSEENKILKKSRLSIEKCWRIALGYLALCLCALIIVFFDTSKTIVLTWWQSGTYAHGFLVLPIFAYLVWQQRLTLSVICPEPKKIALLCIAGMLLVWQIGYVLNVLLVMQFSMVAIIILIAWLFLGNEVISKLVFPLGFLFFAVPFGDLLIPALQDITAIFAVKALQMSSIPVYLEGRYFYIPSGAFEVAESCSGVRYLIASVCLGTLYSYLCFSSIVRRVLFVVFCGIMPIFANAIRAYGIVMIAHLSDYKFAVGVDHILYGWVFFGIVIFFTFWVGGYFWDKKEVSIELPQKQQSTTHKRINFMPLSVATILIIAGVPLLNNLLLSGPNNDLQIKLQLPNGLAGWEGPFNTLSSWQPIFSGAEYEQTAQYHTNDDDVNVYMGYYTQQKQGHELISTKNRFYSKEWKRISDSTITIVLQNSVEWELNEIVLASDEKRRIIWYWYDIGGSFTTNSVKAKLMELPMRMSKKYNRAGVIAVSVDYDMDVRIGRLKIKQFLDNMLLPLLKTNNPQIEYIP